MSCLCLTMFNTGEDGGTVSKCIKHPVSIPADTQVKMVCGGDLLESFSVPNLWAKEHVCIQYSSYICYEITNRDTFGTGVLKLS